MGTQDNCRAPTQHLDGEVTYKYEEVCSDVGRKWRLCELRHGRLKATIGDPCTTLALFEDGRDVILYVQEVGPTARSRSVIGGSAKAARSPPEAFARNVLQPTRCARTRTTSSAYRLGPLVGGKDSVCACLSRAWKAMLVRTDVHMIPRYASTLGIDYEYVYGEQVGCARRAHAAPTVRVRG